MKKIISIIVGMLFIVGCSSNHNYVKEDLVKIYEAPYLEMNMDNELVLEEMIQTLQDRFDEDFTEETLNNHIAIQTFVMLNNIEEKVTVKDIEIKETAKNQYSYTVKLSTNNQNYTSSGSVRYEDSKIVYLEIAQWPTYASDYFK